MGLVGRHRLAMMYLRNAGDGLYSGFKEHAPVCGFLVVSASNVVAHLTHCCQSVSQSPWLSFGPLQHSEEEGGGS